MSNKNKYIMTTLVEKYGETWIKNFPKILVVISKYINDRQEILSTKNYGDRIIYTSSDQNRFYEAAGVEEKEIIKIIHDCPNIPKKYPDQMNPLYNLLFVMGSFYQNNQSVLEKQMKPNNKIDAAHFIRFYLGLRIYSIVQRQIFHYTPRKNVVQYTLDHLTNRYEIAKCDSLYEMIDYFVVSNSKETEKLKIDMANPNDEHIYGFNSKLIGRLKSLLKNLYRATEQNRINGNFNTEEDIQATNGETGKKFFVVNSNVSNTIEILTNKVLTNFIQESEIRMNLVAVACKKAQNISKEKIRIILTEIKTSKDNVLLTRIIKDILSYWIISLNKDADSIHSADFIKKCAIAYSISNTSNTFVVDLKDALFEIISKYSSLYTASESKSTINSFKQAVFLYMVFYISSTK